MALNENYGLQKGEEKTNNGKISFVKTNSDSLLPTSFGVESNWINLHGVETGFSGAERHQMYCLDGSVSGSNLAEKAANVGSSVYDAILGRMVSRFPAHVNKMAFQYLVQNIAYSGCLNESEKVPFVMYVSDEPGADLAFTIISGNRNIWGIMMHDPDNRDNQKLHMSMHLNKADDAQNSIDSANKYLNYYDKSAGICESKLDVVPTYDGGCIVNTGCRTAQIATEEENGQEIQTGLTVSTFSSLLQVDAQNNVKNFPSDEYIASTLVPIKDGHCEDISQDSKIARVEAKVEEDFESLVEQANRIQYYNDPQEINIEE